MRNEDVKAFELAIYFVKNHNYRFVTINGSDGDFWLTNPSNMEFPIIRITGKSAESVYFDKEKMLKIHEALKKLLKTDCRLLTIHTTDETEVDTDPDYEQVIMKSGSSVGKSLVFMFPLVEKAITNFTDNQARYNELLDDLKELNHQKEKVRKIKHKFVLRPSYVVIAICVITYCLTQLVSMVFGISNISAEIFMGAYYRRFVIVNHEYWRFLTVGLTHGSILHLLMNMFSLFYLGPLTEKVYGKRNFMIILLGSTILGTMIFHTFETSLLAVGLSGGIYGLFGALFIQTFVPNSLMRHPALKKWIYQIILINLFVNFMPGIAVSAHLGGLISGLAIGFLLSKDPKLESFKIHAKICFTILVLFLSYRVIIDKNVEKKPYSNEYEIIEVCNKLHLNFYSDNLLKNINKFYYNR